MLLRLCGILGLSALVLALLGAQTVEERAASYMLWGLAILWVVGCGGATFLFREQVRRVVSEIPWGWRKKFVLFATALALVEEAIALFLNNLAPAFGAPAGAYLTATTNYIELVTRHSVVVFIPMFVVWSWLLARYHFTPAQTIGLFGANGVLAELFLSPTALLGAGFWILVYGLMVYLPAYSIPQDRAATMPEWQHYILAILLPIIITIPFAILLGAL